MAKIIRRQAAVLYMYFTGSDIVYREVLDKTRYFQERITEIRENGIWVSAPSPIVYESSASKTVEIYFPYHSVQKIDKVIELVEEEETKKYD